MGNTIEKTSSLLLKFISKVIIDTDNWDCDVGATAFKKIMKILIHNLRPKTSSSDLLIGSLKSRSM